MVEPLLTLMLTQVISQGVGYLARRATEETEFIEQLNKRAKQTRENPPKYVFISYSRASDTETMLAFRELLKGEEVKVFVDVDDIKKGDRISKKVEDGIEKSSCFLVILTPESKQNDWVRQEIDYAKTHEIPVLGILASGNKRSSVPIDLINNNYFDFTSVSQTSDPMYKEIIRTVKGYC